VGLELVGDVVAAGSARAGDAPSGQRNSEQQRKRGEYRVYVRVFCRRTIEACTGRSCKVSP